MVVTRKLLFWPMRDSSRTVLLLPEEKGIFCSSRQGSQMQWKVKTSLGVWAKLT